MNVNEHERISICTIRSKLFRSNVSIAVLHVTVTVTIEALMLIFDLICTNNESIDMEIIQCLTSKLFQVITKLALQQLQKIIIIFIAIAWKRCHNTCPENLKLAKKTIRCPQLFTTFRRSSRHELLTITKAETLMQIKVRENQRDNPE